MLSVLDRHLKLWHLVLANIVALAWFAGMQIATQTALPGVKLFRCPIGMCLGYYSPIELHATLTQNRQERPPVPGRHLAAAGHGAADAAARRVHRHVRLVQPAGPGRRGAAELGSPLCVPLRAAALWPGRLCRELDAGGVLAGLSQHPLPPGAQGEHPDGHQVAARRGVGRHRRRARRRGLGHCAPLRQRRPPRGLARMGSRRGDDQAPLSISANTLRAARKHSTASGTPA